MRSLALKLYAAIELLKKEGGQDLIEYALVVALIALAATSTMSSLGVAINSAFSTVGSSLNNAI